MTEKLQKLDSDECSVSSAADSINKVQEEFFQSISNGHKTGIQKLMRDSTITPWKWQDLDGNSGLMLASMKNQKLIIKMMVKEIEENYPSKCAEILKEWGNLANNNFETPILYISYFGNIDLIVALEKYEVNIRQKSSDGNTVLHYSSQGNQPSSLIYFYYKYKLEINEQNSFGRTALHEAVLTSSIYSVKFILKLTQELELKDRSGKTALHMAVEVESASIIRELLMNGADRDSTNNSGKTPIDLAVIPEIKKLLGKDLPFLGSIQIKHSLIKQKPSQANIWAFFILYGLTFVSFIAIVIPGNLINN